MAMRPDGLTRGRARGTRAQKTSRIWPPCEVTEKSMISWSHECIEFFMCTSWAWRHAPWIIAFRRHGVIHDVTPMTVCYFTEVRQVTPCWLSRALSLGGVDLQSRQSSPQPKPRCPKAKWLILFTFWCQIPPLYIRKLDIWVNFAMELAAATAAKMTVTVL